MRIVTAIFYVLAFAVLSHSAQAQKDEMNNPGAQYNLTTTISVFPNPAIEYLNVKFDDPIAKTALLTVHNVIGNTVEVERETIDEHELRLKVKDLPVGYYLLAVRDEESNSRSMIKFLKR